MKRLITSIFCFLMLSCSMTLPKKQSINGVSFVAANEAVNQSHIDPIIGVNANFASVMPFGFIRNLDSPEIIYNTNRQWFGETKEGTIQYIEQLQRNNIKIMLKPQIWVWHGEFTGDIEMKSDVDWKLLEKSYSKFILDYAQVAQETNVEILCMGTELNTFVSARPEFWKELIVKIRKVYKGKLTYAENWDTYYNVTFWSELDYIGIDAYFPLSSERTPTIENLKVGWQPHKEQIKELYQKINKPILFTEYGYRSTHFTAKEPWNSDHKIKEVNHYAQVNSLQALYDEFWKEDWFAGGFLWKWFNAHERVGGNNNAQFTPQNKPAESIVRDNYSQY